MEQPSGEETGSLLGSVWALLSRHLMEYLGQPLTRPPEFSISD